MSHTHSRCNQFNERTKQKEEEIVETKFLMITCLKILVNFFLIKKNIRKYFPFNYSLPFSRLIFLKSQIKVPQALDSSMLICKREISACLSVALSFDLFVLVRCILLIFQLPLMKLNILLIMNNSKSSIEWKTILKKRDSHFWSYICSGDWKKTFLK